MSLKKSCSVIFAMYAVVALVVGYVVYRRFPLAGAAFGGGIVGGGIVWLGLAYLFGIWTKLAEARRLRRTLEGGPPPDDEKIAVVGTIEPISAQLTSPFTGRPCVAYKYEVRKGESLLYDGFALTPSAIYSQHGQIRILAYPTLEVTPRLVPNSEAVSNFEAYIERTEFREPSLDNVRAMFQQAMADFNDDDGSIRRDIRMGRDGVSIERATFTEWSVAPGDRVFAMGRYSMQRGGLVPEPGMPLSLVIRDVPPSGIGGRSIAAAIGNLIGAAIFLGVAAAALIGFFAFVPLSASEQMTPGLTPTWAEVRLERTIERRLRGRMRRAGMLDSGTVMPQLDLGTARGRLNAGGRDVPVSRAAAVRSGDFTEIHIDEESIVLTLEKSDPVKLRFGNEVIDPHTVDRDRDADVEITERSDTEVAGRLTYFRDDATSPACRVTFRAAVRGSGFSSAADVPRPGASRRGGNA